MKRPHHQGYDDRLDDSMRGQSKQSYKARRDESKGMEKSVGHAAYSSDRGMDKSAKKRYDHAMKASHHSYMSKHHKGKM